MLLLPAFQRIQDVTVYADDTVWFRFYLIGKDPTVRRREDGSPVFLLVKYAFDEESTDGKLQLPPGGGTMNFDVEFVIAPETEEEVRKQLQTWVNAEYVRRKRDPALNKGPEFRVPTPPKVEIADPTWSHGTARMITTSSNALVQGTVSAGPASLLYGNTVVFQMDLTAAGATYMHDTLAGRDGDDGIDLAPIAVVYELKFWGRLPEVKISVKASSERVHSQLKKVEESRGEGGQGACSSDEIAEYKQKQISSASLVESGVVEIHIDKGDAVLGDDQVEDLRQYALDMFDTMIEERFLEPMPDDDLDDPELPDGEFNGGEGSGHRWAGRLFLDIDQGGASTEIEGDVPDLATLTASSGGNFAARVSSLEVRKGHELIFYEQANFQGARVSYKTSRSNLEDGWNDRFRSVRVVRPSTTRYALTEDSSKVQMDLSIELSQSQVVEWAINPQATLSSFFADMSASQIAQHVRVVDLGDDMFRRLDLTARAFASFDAEHLDYVELHVDYSGTDENRERQLRSHTFTFTESGKPQRWSVPLIGSDRDYDYKWRMGYSNGKVGPWSRAYRSTATELNVSVEDPGKLDVLLIAQGIDWKIVNSVAVQLSYADAAAGIERSKHLFLDKTQPTALWREYLFTQVSGPVRVEPVYTLEDGAVIVGKVTESTAPQVVIPPPHVDTLDVTLVPAGDWSQVAQCKVFMRYDDGQRPPVDGEYTLKSLEESATWRVRLVDANNRHFQYRTFVTWKVVDKAPDDSGWIDAEGDQGLLIRVASVPTFALDVYSTLVDFEISPVVTVAIAHPSLPGGRKTLTFTRQETQRVQASVKPDDDRSFSYTITYLSPEVEPVVEGPVTSRDTVVFVPNHKRPRPGKATLQVRGDLIAYDRLMLVQVDLSYRDPNGELTTDTLVLTADNRTGSFEAETSDRNHKVFDYQVTFFTAAGDAVPGPSGAHRTPLLILKNPALPSE
jgi:hypothetical protein